MCLLVEFPQIRHRRGALAHSFGLDALLHIAGGNDGLPQAGVPAFAVRPVKVGWKSAGNDGNLKWILWDFDGIEEDSNGI